MFVQNFFRDFTYQNYENRLIIDGVIPKNKWRAFLGHSAYRRRCIMHRLPGRRWRRRRRRSRRRGGVPQRARGTAAIQLGRHVHEGRRRISRLLVLVDRRRPETGQSARLPCRTRLLTSRVRAATHRSRRVCTAHHLYSLPVLSLCLSVCPSVAGGFSRHFSSTLPVLPCLLLFRAVD